MGSCCICGREAKRTVHGLWWCEKHVDYTRGKREQVTQSKEKEEVRKVDLDLAWV